MSKTPWRIDEKVAEAISDIVAEKLRNADEALKLSQEMGNLCNDKRLIIVEMAIAVMLAHIIDTYKPDEKQKVFDRFINQVLGMAE